MLRLRGSLALLVLVFAVFSGFRALASYARPPKTLTPQLQAILFADDFCTPNQLVDFVLDPLGPHRKLVALTVASSSSDLPLPPRVTLRKDESGALRRSMGAEGPGHLVVFSPTGRLVFSGGIDARGQRVLQSSLSTYRGAGRVRTAATSPVVRCESLLTDG